MGKKGFALVLTLWIVAIMSLASALYLSYGKKTVKKTFLLEKKLKMIMEIESTVQLLKFYGTTGSILTNKITNSGLKKLFPSFPIMFFTDGREVKWNNQTISIQDTSGLIGTSDLDALSNYFISTEKKLKDKKVIIENSIKDWLDSNSFTLLNGAEESFYKHQGLSYTPRNENYFSSIDEIFLVRGIYENNLTTKILKSNIILSDYVTRNILAMKLVLLSKIYALSKTDLEQLKEAKERGSENFLRLFFRLRPEELNKEGTTVSSSRIMKVIIDYKNETIHEKISLILSFRLNILGASEILEYN